MFDGDVRPRVFRVGVNGAVQYSIWPADAPIPRGWRDEGTIGSRADCLAHVDEVWVDMRPLDLRRRLDRREGAAP